MTKEINITIENKLVMEKRDMNVYHHSTRSAHMISHGSSVTLPLGAIIEDDYLHISIVSGPGHLENKSVVNLPPWANFEFSSREDVTVIHSGNRTFLKIPPGPPLWQLKITRTYSDSIDYEMDRITIGDEQMQYQ